MSTKRIDISQINPTYYTPLIELNKQLQASALTESERLMIYIRASQINGCAYCIQSHIKDAIKNGEKQYRIHALAAWEDSPFFSDAEQSILRITEEITNISISGLTESTYSLARQLFDDQKLADIIMAATCINAWNRIGRGIMLEPFPSQT